MTGVFQRFCIFDSSGLSSSTGTIAIDTHQDPTTGQRFTLWRDIQLVFKGAQYIRNGDALVSFMTDEDFEDLVPYRIIYHPDIVLDVVIDSGFSAGNSTRSSTSHSQSVSLASTTSTPISHGTTSIDTRYMEELGSSSPTSPTPGLYSDPITTAAPVDLVQACFQKLDQELDSNKAFRAEVGIELLHNRAFRAEMTDSVQQVNNRLAILQKRIESLITQTYELHEYPIPRLFIVLPKYSNRRRDHLSPRKTLIKQFRLYFLCECGE
ncbi:hypothetical protein B0O80DRAFT_485256, partial [Mortierella sp. GBAus27b]